VTSFAKPVFRLIALGIALASVSFAGCPDYSHLKSVPDYENMTDSGEVNE